MPGKGRGPRRLLESRSVLSPGPRRLLPPACPPNPSGNLLTEIKRKMGSEDLIGDGDGDDWWQTSGSVLHGEGEATQAQREKETEAEDDAIR